jgi:hypothetical protein
MDADTAGTAGADAEAALVEAEEGEAAVVEVAAEATERRE